MNLRLAEVSLSAWVPVPTLEPGGTRGSWILADPAWAFVNIWGMYQQMKDCFLFLPLFFSVNLPFKTIVFEKSFIGPGTIA